VNAAELEAWILATSPRAVAYARSLLRNTADAEDIVQDCYCRLIAKQETYNLAEDGLKLLLRSISNACINLRTRRRGLLGLSRQTTDGEVSLDPEDAKSLPPESRLQATELQAAIGEALQKLPTQQRAAVELKSLGHTQAEIAEILETTPSHAGVLIHRARQTLSILLADFLEGLPHDA
jgi:RNA polymerase sigma factor (sigma-70 family)